MQSSPSLLRPLAVCLLVVPSFTLAPPRTDAAQAEADTVECSDCKGDGRALAACPDCDGERTVRCSECEVPRLGGAYSDEVLRKLAARCVEAPEAAEELKSDIARLMEMAAALEEQLGALPRTKLEPGRIRCPAKCVEGQSFHNPGHECLPCDGEGSFECPPCKGEGELKCFTCPGRRKVEVPCRPCNQTGRVSASSDASDRDPARCPWCDDAKTRECRPCTEESAEEDPCRSCAGDGERVCETCAGSRRAPCAKCSGTGDLSSYFGSKGSNRCDVCKRKGYRKCGACRRGSTECEECEGEGERVYACKACDDTLQRACSGCSLGVGDAWTWAGDVLLERGETGLALEYYRVALEREALQSRERPQHYLGDEAGKRAFEQDLEARVEAVEERIRAAEGAR